MEFENDVDVHPVPPASGSVDRAVSVEPPIAECEITGATGFQVRNRPVVAPGYSGSEEPVRCATCGFPLLPAETDPCHRCREGGWAHAQDDWEHAQEAWDHASADQVAAEVEYTAALQAREAAEAAWDSARTAWKQAESVWADAEQKSTEAQGTAQQREVEWEQAQTAWEQAQEAHAQYERHGRKPSSNLDGEDLDE